MDVSKREAENTAIKERLKAKGLRSEAARKRQHIKELEERASRQGRGGKLLALGGPAGNLLSMRQKHRSADSSREATRLRREAESLEKRALEAEKDAAEWDKKAKAAQY